MDIVIETATATATSSGGGSGSWVSGDGAQLFFGALLAVFAGWAANWLHSKWETRARRKVLFPMLSYQLKGIASEPPPYDSSWPILRDTIHITAADELLAAYAIDPRKERKLMAALTAWQARQSAHNELVKITNEGFLTNSIPPQYGPLWYEYLNVMHGLLIALRGDVIAAMPLEYRSGELPREAGFLMEIKEPPKPRPTEDQR